jgi:hypothetical protein
MAKLNLKSGLVALVDHNICTFVALLHGRLVSAPNSMAALVG